METIGFIGVGKIGLAISENLIKSGRRVVGNKVHREDVVGLPAKHLACPAVDRPHAKRGCR